MTMTVLDHAPVTGDAGRVTGERQERPDPEVPERPRRRTFTAAYKQEILAAYDAAGPGEKGAMLRREGLYSSLITEWRRARDAGALAGVKQPRGRPAGEPRGRGHRARADLVTDEAISVMAPRIGTRAACRAAGVAQASWYRRHRAS